MPQILIFDKMKSLHKTECRGNSLLPFITILCACIFALMFDFGPLFVYILFILGSLLLGIFLNKYNGYSIIKFVLFIILVLYLTAFIGFRDFGVGWDTNVYIDSYWDSSLFIKGLRDFSDFDYVNNGFLILSIVGRKFSNDHQTLLLLTALVINFFTFLTVYIANKDKIKINWVIYISFWQLLFMNNSMNLMRQYCAMSLMLLSVLLFIKKKYLWCVICIFVAYEFHSSAIIGLFPYVFYLLDKTIKTRQRNLLTICVLILICIGVIGIFKILLLGVDMGVINDHFDAYTDNQTGRGENLFGVSYFVISSLFIYICLFLYKKKLISNSITYMLITIYTLSFVLRIAAFSLVWFSRLSDYYNYYVYFALAYLMTLYSKQIPIVVQIMVYACLLYTWLNTCIIFPGGETYPYHSLILGI